MATRSPSARPRRRPAPRGRRRLKRAPPRRRSGAAASTLRPVPCSRCCRRLAWAASSNASRLVRRHAEHAEKRSQRHLAPAPVAREACHAVQVPLEEMPVEIREPQPLPERAPPAARPRPAPAPGANLVDPNLQHCAWPSAADGDRPDKRMSERAPLAVALRFAWPKLPPLTYLGGRRPATPTRVERGKEDGVSRVDRQDRLELAREVPVNGPLGERELVNRHKASVRPRTGESKGALVPA